MFNIRIFQRERYLYGHVREFNVPTAAYVKLDGPLDGNSNDVILCNV
jgi:hypothetical protein